MGLRREPQPAIPIVMPSRSSATTSSSVMRLSVTRGPCRSSVDELLSRLVGRGREVELEGEAHLAPEAAPRVDRLDRAQRLLRPSDDERALGRDDAGDLAR